MHRESIRPSLESTYALMAIISAALLAAVSCTNAETAVEQPRFDHVPSSCAVALNPARSDIDQFADGLREDRDRVSTDPDPDLYEESIGVRCAAIFTGSGAWAPLDDASLRPTSRHLFVSFAVILAADTIADPVEYTRNLFDRRRPHGAVQRTGIGDSAYALTTSSRYPGGITGTVAGSVEIRFRTSNLIVKVDAGGINIHDNHEPAQLLADLAHDAEAIATSLATNVDTVMT